MPGAPSISPDCLRPPAFIIPAFQTKSRPQPTASRLQGQPRVPGLPTALRVTLNPQTGPHLEVPVACGQSEFWLQKPQGGLGGHGGRDLRGSCAHQGPAPLATCGRSMGVPGGTGSVTAEPPCPSLASLMSAFPGPFDLAFNYWSPPGSRHRHPQAPSPRREDYPDPRPQPVAPSWVLRGSRPHRGPRGHSRLCSGGDVAGPGCLGSSGLPPGPTLGEEAAGEKEPRRFFHLRLAQGCTRWGPTVRVSVSPSLPLRLGSLAFSDRPR